MLKQLATHVAKPALKLLKATPLYLSPGKYYFHAEGNPPATPSTKIANEKSNKILPRLPRK